MGTGQCTPLGGMEVVALILLLCSGEIGILLLHNTGWETLPTPVPNAEPLPGFSGAPRVIYSEVMVPRQLELRHGAEVRSSGE
ncbi:UNVERIFIED_CONTAM: hypothetical protein H355_013485 [Colinus virginianus]|nr:hypothetical protein H355_013485 [Colinus virginianus]